MIILEISKPKVVLDQMNYAVLCVRTQCFDIPHNVTWHNIESLNYNHTEHTLHVCGTSMKSTLLMRTRPLHITQALRCADLLLVFPFTRFSFSNLIQSFFLLVYMYIFDFGMLLRLSINTIIFSKKHSQLLPS